MLEKKLERPRKKGESRSILERVITSPALLSPNPLKNIGTNLGIKIHVIAQDTVRKAKKNVKEELMNLLRDSLPARARRAMKGTRIEAENIDAEVTNRRSGILKEA